MACSPPATVSARCRPRSFWTAGVVSASRKLATPPAGGCVRGCGGRRQIPLISRPASGAAVPGWEFNWYCIVAYDVRITQVDRSLDFRRQVSDTLVFLQAG